MVGLLSLVQGAVWTVDELEFHRRRPQRTTEVRQHSVSPHPRPAVYEDSPPSPTVYQDSFQRSLQTALMNLGKTGDTPCLYLVEYNLMPRRALPGLLRCCGRPVASTSVASWDRRLRQVRAQHSVVVVTIVSDTRRTTPVQRRGTVGCLMTRSRSPACSTSPVRSHKPS